MTQTEQLKADLATKNGKALAQSQAEPSTLDTMLDNPRYKTRFEAMLGKKAAGFMSSILSLYNSNAQLKACDPRSILSAAAIAASLDLPINPSLGFAHIVPYGGKAQFQLGWRGYVQLAQRSGLYKTINVTEVYEGQLVESNPFTGKMEFDASLKKSDVVIGYVCYFELLNGFEKYGWITKDDAIKHGKKYSKSFNSAASQWQQNIDAMGRKTIIKATLGKYGPMSVDMQKAHIADQAVITAKTDDITEADLSYDDNPGADGIPAEEIPFGADKK
jgi:recombination protein RecT